MRTITLPLPLLGFTVVTRAALGAGLGMLLAQRLTLGQRRSIGVALVAFGAATTIPLARQFARRLRPDLSQVSRDLRLVGVSRYARKGDDAD